ncbi:MAG: murein L,D-transpeptidase [Verrucomicrobia bacterium]|nr:MAG: murein L,D-transpeptidase [Verrucomicrobiota bacterium]
MRRRPKLPLGAVHRGHRVKRRRGPWWRRPVLLLLSAVFAGAAGWYLLRGRSGDLPSPATLVPIPAADTEAGPAEASVDPLDTAAEAGDLIPISEPVPTEIEAPSAPPPSPVFAPGEKNFRPRPPRDVFEAQIALTRDGLSPGAIDGAWGRITRNAVIAFQRKHGLRVTAQLDTKTRDALLMVESPLTTYEITAEDFVRLRPLPKGWVERAALDRLDYSSILELVAEKHWTHPNQIKRLNPDIDWDKVTTGTRVIVPRVFRRKPATQPALIVIHLAEKTLQLYDANSRLLAHFPCSIARRVEKRPVGELAVEEAARDPNYTFDPENFPDSAEAQRIGRKLVLPPGPNNPVGVAWIGLNLPGYGIHGTPEPERVGRPESSGCFRLTNWDARFLVDLVYVGMRVQVEP